MALQKKIFSEGNFAYNSFSRSYMMDLIITEISADPSAEVSRIQYRFQFRTGANNRFTGNLPCKVKIDGKQAADKTVPISAAYNETYLLAEGTVNVPNRPEESRTIPVEASVAEIAGNPYSPPELHIRGTIQLTRIPGTSTVSCTDAYVESTAAVSVTRYDPAFRHAIRYEFGKLSGYLTETGGSSSEEIRMSQTSIPFYIPPEFYGEFPTEREKECILECKTYRGAALVGTASTSFTVMAMESRCRPELSGTVADVLDRTKALTGTASTLIRYRSTARCGARAKAVNGAKLISCQVNGVPIRDQWADIARAEQAKYRFTAVDSRGFSSSFTVDRKLIAYVPLKLSVTARRDTPTGSTAKIRLQGEFFDGTFGAKHNTLAISYQVEGGPSGTVQAAISGRVYEAVIPVQNVQYDRSYPVTVTAEDLLDRVTVKTEIHPGMPLFCWNRDRFRFHVPAEPERGILPEKIVLMDTAGEEQFESMLDALLQKMENGSILPLSFMVSPAISGHPYTGFLAKTSNNYAYLYCITYAYDGGGFYKSKYGGQWKAGRKMKL